MILERYLNLPELLEKSSHFLLGPRGSGKSTLIKRDCLDRADYIDLLDSRIYLKLKRDPSLLSPMTSRSMVVIDEVQRVPELLHEVHRLIENEGKRFLLTGSSSRKLKRGGANLLAGRSFMAQFFPLTWREISRSQDFDLSRYLRFGGLPMAYLGEYPEEYLYAYVETYLKEEIQSEGLTRNLSNYTRFLESASCNNAQLLNYSKVASDAGLSPNTVRDYYQILTDTLLAFEVPPWRGSKKRKPVQTAKFYFFDPGVARTLKGTSGSDGTSFEQFIACELRAYLSYGKIRLPLQFWRSKSRMEVDFVVGDQVAIEVKSSQRVGERDHKGLRAIAEEAPWRYLLLVSQDRTPMKCRDGIEHLYWENFLNDLWEGRFFP